MTPLVDPIRLVQLARAVEAGGYYNLSKLLWALAYSQEVRAGGALPKGAELEAELGRLAADLRGAGAPAEVLRALERGRAGVSEDRTIPATDIPAVEVCRACGQLFLGQELASCPRCGAHRLTFREFLPVYYLEPLTPEAVLEALASGPAEVGAAIGGLSESQMSRDPADGEWAVRNVLWHLLMAQEVLAARVEKMLQEDDPSLEAVAVWTLQGAESLSAGEIFERYRGSREALVRRLGRIDPAGWWRSARHPEFIRFNLLQQTGYHAKHERSHLPQIAEIRRALGAPVAVGAPVTQATSTLEH